MIKKLVLVVALFATLLVAVVTVRERIDYKQVSHKPTFKEEVIGIFSTGLLVRPVSRDPDLSCQTRDFLVLWNGSIRRVTPSDACLINLVDY